jgi:predicted Zn-dependent protease
VKGQILSPNKIDLLLHHAYNSPVAHDKSRKTVAHSVEGVTEMSGLFYNLGRMVGPRVRKARWIWQSITGTEADAIKVENDVGRDLARQIGYQLKPDSHSDAEELLNKIGSRLAARVTNRFRTFSFESVEGPEPNAFALPGGFIFVARSLTELCQSQEDEIAFILGHEMAHVIRGHAMHRLISNSAISAASRAAPVHGVLSRWLKKAGLQLLESAYSQDLEFEADRFGIRLAAAARYDPQAALQLLARLEKLSRPPALLNLGSYFSSHPAYEVRINNIVRALSNRRLE